MLTNCWYIAAESGELKGNRPLARQVAGLPIVLFRNTSGQATALFDRCPHRNVQLSRGKVKNGCLQCPYHGWEFDSTGQCVYIPSQLPGEKIPPGAKAEVIALIEQEGYLWVWIGDKAAEGLPFSFPHYQEKGWEHGYLKMTVKNTVENVIENFIDCPHTGYIHGGLFRSPASHLARTKVQAVDDGVIIDIDEENQGNSLLKQLLVGKAQATHRDRYIYPSTVQVAYGFGPNKQMIGYQNMTPISEFETAVHVIVTWQMGLLNPLVKLFFPFFGKMVLKQDIWVLENQGRLIQKFGEKFTSVSADTANLWIRAARKRIQKGEAAPTDREKDIHFRL